MKIITVDSEGIVTVQGTFTICYDSDGSINNSVWVILLSYTYQSETFSTEWLFWEHAIETFILHSTYSVI